MALLRNIRVTGLNCEDSDFVYLCTGQGDLYSYNRHLQQLRQEPSTPQTFDVITKIVLTSDFIIGRDIWGTLVFWDRNTRLFVKSIPLVNLHSKRVDKSQVSPLPSRSHGLMTSGDWLYTTNPYGEFLQLNLKTGEVVFFDNGHHGYYEYILFFDHNTLYVTNTSGQLWRVCLKTMSMHLQGDFTSGAAHKIIHDTRHDRLLIADDGFCGITCFCLQTEKFQSHTYTYDDVESIALSPDQSTIYMACFDHYIYILNNKKMPEVDSRFGPFKFQVSEMEQTADGHELFVILQSGEVFCVDIAVNDIQKIGSFGSDAIWEIQLTSNRAAVAQENGLLTSCALSVSSHGVLHAGNVSSVQLPFGRIRRVKHHKPADVLLTAHTDKKVCILSPSGEILRTISTHSIVRDIAISPSGNQCAAIDESGHLYLFSVDSAVLSKHKVSHAAWACEFASEDTVIVGERFQNVFDANKQRQMRSNLIFCRTQGPYSQMRRHHMPGSVKRLKRIDDDHILITGTNSIGISLFSLSLDKIVSKFTDWVVSTTEDALCIDQHIYSIGYGFNINTYGKTSGIQDCQFDFVDRYPKTMLSINQNEQQFLLVGGRGGMVDCYLRQNDGTLSKRSSLNLSHIASLNPVEVVDA